MALTCARCGTQNPDGNSFCQACGTPLAVVVGPPPVGPPPVGPPPVGPPPGAPSPIIGPPPGLPPPAYQSPYYAPGAGGFQAPVHRTPWVLIVSAFLGLIVVMAGCGTAYAFLNARNQTSAGVLPSPSPAGTPSPVQTTSPPARSSSASTSAESVTLPPGCAAANTAPTLPLPNPTPAA